MVASSRPAHSRTTLNLRKDLLDRARRLSGIKKKTDLVHAGLQALIAREALRRLASVGDQRLKPGVDQVGLQALIAREALRRAASMGGAYPNAKAPPRRRW